MHAEVIAVGTELLMGELVDTNSGFLASELTKVGVELRWSSKVSDDPELLFEAISQAFQRADVTITTGGLGPTSDDLTRETIARVFGEKMEIQDDLLEHLRALFAGRGNPMPATNLKQATLIPSAQVIPNPMGTAPGWWAERDGHIIVAMPGPPRELQPMWANEVSPKIKERNPGIAIVTRNIKTFGMSEGLLDEMLSPLFQSENPYLGIYSKQDGIHLRAIANAPTEAEARELIEPFEEEIRRVAGDAIWGFDDETPETQVAAWLAENNKTLGVVESFTGGLIASNLSDIDGMQKHLLGSLVTHTPKVIQDLGVSQSVIDEHGPASAQAAEAMAEAARTRFGSDIGLSITGAVTVPTSAGGPVGTSHIGISADGVTSSTSGRYPTSRLRMRSRAVTHALLSLIQVLKENYTSNLEPFV